MAGGRLAAGCLAVPSDDLTPSVLGFAAAAAAAAVATVADSFVVFAAVGGLIFLASFVHEEAKCWSDRHL